MFDQWLAKQEFEKKLRDVGYADERIAQEWQKLEKLFFRLCIANALNSLTEKEREQAMGGIPEERLSPEQFFSNIKTYFSSRSDALDVQKIVDQSAIQTYETYAELIAPGGSHG